MTTRPERQNVKAEQMLEKFVDEYSIIRGLDPEYVYSMHVGTERECHVRISDLREVLAQLTALQAERDALRAERDELRKLLTRITGNLMAASDLLRRIHDDVPNSKRNPLFTTMVNDYEHVAELGRVACNNYNQAPSDG